MKLSRTTAAAVTLTFAGLLALTAACGRPAHRSILAVGQYLRVCA
jgi:hypothetical protein